MLGSGGSRNERDVVERLPVRQPASDVDRRQGEAKIGM
jgi:hypothetical protein